MECKSCHFDETEVTHTRHHIIENSIIRRRKCKRCKFCFTTEEKIEHFKDGRFKKDFLE